MKLCIGDVVKVRNGAIGMVDHIQYRDENGYLSDDNTTYLGQGMELEDIEDFAIIPQKEVKWAWYSPNELVEIVCSSSQYAVENPLDDDEDDEDDDWCDEEDE